MIQLSSRPYPWSLARTLGCLLSCGIVAVSVAASVAADEPVTPPAVGQSGEAQRVESVIEPPITAEEREHWSFRPLVRPAVPVVADGGWCRSPIDRFLWSPWQTKKLRPQPAAGRVTLARRLYFDLTGLPPTPAELDAFQQDPAPDAVERLIDFLLASPAYGEHWGQYWLDLARFAETDGYEHDLIRKEAWRYRDWVIAALNQDMPYEDFVRRQLAGDELAPRDPLAAIPTGFCLAGPDMPDLNSQEERRHQILNELTSTVGSVLLGLQFGCAQCHDHKYDPLSLADFYRLRAVFEPAVKVTKNVSVSVLAEKPGEPPAPSHIWLRGDWRRPGSMITAGYPRIVANGSSAPTSTAGKASTGRRLALANWLTHPSHPLTARVIVNRLWQFHFGAGLCRTPSDLGMVGESPSHPELLDWLAVEFVECGGSWKQFHRLLLTSAVYQQASRPADDGWDAATTETAREAWRISLANDPANLQLARFPRQRLRGESLRDAMLAISGELVEQQGGPGVMPPLPAEVVRMLLKNQWQVSARAADHRRRSVYVFARRNLRYPLFDAFDRPDANTSCPERPRSTTAPQSLMLLNSEVSWSFARSLAGRIWREGGDTDAERVALLTKLAWGRVPHSDEAQRLASFWRDQAEHLREEQRASESLLVPFPWPATESPVRGAALVDLCLAVLNSSEFLYVD